MLTRTLSEKKSEMCILGVIALMYIAMCAEADMFVPAFPQMLNYFATDEDKIQLILSLNLAGLCIASLICGPLSDTFGRRKILLIGLIGFLISSLGAVFANNFQTMLLWRIIQGTSASVPMVIGSAILLDKYSLEKASRLIGTLNSVITATMAGAPILGAYLSHAFDWRANFVVITGLVALSLIGTLLFIEETLPTENRKPFYFRMVIKNYSILISNFTFMGYAIIALMPFTAIVIYISNLSLIFMNHLGVSPNEFGYFQATTMLSYMFASGISSPLIAKKGSEFTKNFGSVMTICGGISLFLTALFNPSSPMLICGSMAIFSAGGALILGIFVMKALDLFPEIKGTASSMMTAIRQFLASALVLVSEFFFDGTILPIAMIIISYLAIAFIWYIALQPAGTLFKTISSKTS